MLLGLQVPSLLRIFAPYCQLSINMTYFIDYIIAIGYTYISNIRVLIDNFPSNNYFPYSLQYNLNEQFSEEIMKEYCSQTSFHKLSRKRQCNLYTEDNKLTFYGHILQEWL